MPSLYDAILVKGVTRYRRDKKFLKKDEELPEEVKEIITLDNIVDENGLIVVDSKTEEAKKLTPEEEAELDAEDTTPEPSVDEQTTTAETETTPEQNENEEDLSDVTLENEDGSKSKVEDGPEKPAETVAPDDVEPPKPAEDTTPEPSVDEPAKPVRKVLPLKSKVPQSKPGMGFPRVNGRTVDIFDGVTPHTHVKLVGGHTVPLSAKSYQTKTDAQIEQRLKDLGYKIVDINAMAQEADLANSGILLDNEDGADADGLVDDRP